MAKKREPIFEWDAEEGLAVCTLTDGVKYFTGFAKCHPDDNDMKSEKTGCYIALQRAEIDYLKHCKNNVIKPQLDSLLHLKSVVSQSKKYNEKDYMSIMLDRQILQQKCDYETIRDMIKNKERGLRYMIAEKEDFYQNIRANRAKEQKVFPINFTNNNGGDSDVLEELL